MAGASVCVARYHRTPAKIPLQRTLGPGKLTPQKWPHHQKSEPRAEARAGQPVLELGAFRRLLQMKPLLDLEQPFDPHAPAEVEWSFEANAPRLRRTHRVRPARPDRKRVA